MRRLRALWTSFRTWLRSLLRAGLTPRDVGWAVAVGIFVGVLPVYGLHLPACVLLARQLKLNLVITYAAAQISNPVFAPFLVVGEIAVGELVRHGALRTVDEESAGRFDLSMVREAPDLFLSCLLGSLLFGLVLAPLLGALASAIFRWRLNRRAAA
jgi:uncharacterized protein (DUF2062 family)